MSPRTFSLEALCRSHVQAFNDTKSASADGLTSARLLASARIITSSPALKAAAAEFRMDAVNAALAEIVSRLATTFAQFISAITDVRQPV